MSRSLDPSPGLIAPACSDELIGLTKAEAVAAPFGDVEKIIITATADQLRPRAVLHVHVSADTLRDQDGVARVEQIGAITAQHARDLLVGCRIRVVPVIDLADGTAVDAYEATGRLREQVVLRDVFDVFPFGERPARQCDLDHARPFRIGQSGQTRADNLNPLSRSGHRAKTLGGWRRTNDEPGQTSWISPTGQGYQVAHGRTTAG